MDKIASVWCMSGTASTVIGDKLQCVCAVKVKEQASKAEQTMIRGEQRHQAMELKRHWHCVSPVVASQ